MSCTVTTTFMLGKQSGALGFFLGALVLPLIIPWSRRYILRHVDKVVFKEVMRALYPIQFFVVLLDSNIDVIECFDSSAQVMARGVYIPECFYNIAGWSFCEEALQLQELLFYMLFALKVLTVAIFLLAVSMHNASEREGAVMGFSALSGITLLAAYYGAGLRSCNCKPSDKSGSVTSSFIAIHAFLFFLALLSRRRRLLGQDPDALKESEKNYEMSSSNAETDLKTSASNSNGNAISSNNESSAHDAAAVSAGADA